MASASLEYFPIRGRGEPIRLMLSDLEIPFTEDGMAKFKENYSNLDEFPFQQLPRLTIDGEKIVQMNSILEYLAIRAGKNGGSSNKERYQISSLTYAVEDFACAYTKRVYTPDNAELLKEFATTFTDKAFGHFEHIVKKSNTEYFFYDYPTFPEYHLLYIVIAVQTLRPSLFDSATKFPVLAKWFAAMSARKGIKEYLASDKVPKQFNGNATADAPCC
ncbi:hypothetical protein T439DRAFT_56649 [Meredithblackwellia eburnea MCA 4105]